MPTPSIAIISFGSNIGNGRELFEKVSEELNNAGFPIWEKAKLYQTKPVECLHAQADFTNTIFCIKLSHSSSPKNILHLLNTIETKLGRKRPFFHAPRTVDLDLIFFDNITMNTDELTLPHPRWHKRAFVLIPLADLFKKIFIKDSSLKEKWGKIEQSIESYLKECDSTDVIEI